MEVGLILTLWCLNMAAGEARDLTTNNNVVNCNGFQAKTLNRITWVKHKLNTVKCIQMVPREELQKHKLVFGLLDLRACNLQALNKCISIPSITAVHWAQQDLNMKDKGRSWRKSPFNVTDDTAVSDILEVGRASLPRLILIPPMEAATWACRKLPWHGRWRNFFRAGTCDAPIRYSITFWRRKNVQ